MKKAAYIEKLLLSLQFRDLFKEIDKETRRPRLYQKKKKGPTKLLNLTT